MVGDWSSGYCVWCETDVLLGVCCMRSSINGGPMNVILCHSLSGCLEGLDGVSGLLEYHSEARPISCFSIVIGPIPHAREIWYLSNLITASVRRTEDYSNLEDLVL